jgi:hypothetical protein
MSGSIDYAALFVTSSSSSQSLLDTIYGISSSSSSSAGNALQALSNAEKNQTQEVAATEKKPQVQRDISAFQKAVANAKDAASALKDPAVLKVLLTANGLGDQLSYTALAQKALLSDPSDSSSLVNQLSNTQWKSVAETYQFATKGLSVLQDSQVQATLANAYAEVTWRESLDATTPGLSNALTFRSEASTITSVDQILGDSVLREVVTTALGIPKEIAYQDIEAQEKAISTRLDISKFQDPKFVETFTQKYLIAAQDSSSSSSSSSLTSLAIQASSSGLVV